MTRIYHNPRCSKSRQTLELLRAEGVEPEIELYLETPLDAETIANLLGKLVPIVIEIMMDHPKHDWGAATYPVVKDSA